MAALDRPVARTRPVYLNLLAIRLPLPAFVSILHRASGALLFLAGIPFLLWAVQRALVSADAWAGIQGMAAHPLGKLLLLVLAWAYLHHFLAGLRHLLMDLHVGVTLQAGRRSAAIALVVSLLLTLGVAIRLW
jgi:succinate dehydrogenase / fumarate reductase cytochrome b subunit